MHHRKYRLKEILLALVLFLFTPALIAGSLNICGTTIAHAIHSVSQGQPVVVVAALCNKCSALVVKKDGPVRQVSDLKGKKIGYVPGTMHEILLRETLTPNGLNPNRDVRLNRVDFFDMGMALVRGGIDAFLSGVIKVRQIYILDPVDYPQFAFPA